MMLNFKVVWVKLLVPFLDLHSCESLIQDGHRKICESNKLEEIRKARKEIAEYENSKNSSSAKESFNKFYTTTEVLDRISQRKINLLITGIKFIILNHVINIIITFVMVIFKCFKYMLAI